MESFQIALECITSPVLVCNRATRQILAVNQRAIHPYDRRYTEQFWLQAVHDRTIYVVEHRLRRADGEYRLMAVREVPILIPDGHSRMGGTSF